MLSVMSHGLPQQIVEIEKFKIKMAARFPLLVGVKFFFRPHGLLPHMPSYHEAVEIEGSFSDFCGAFDGVT